MVTKTPPVTEKSTANATQTIMVVGIISSLLINTLCLYLLLGYSINFNILANKDVPRTENSVGLKKVLLDLEYEKVGGKENYEVLQKYTQMQLKEQIPQIKKAIEGGTLPGAQATPSAEPQGTISTEEIKKIMDDAAIEGNKNSDILVVEYSDTECPFCMRQYHDTKLFPTLLTQYGDKISVAFKNNRGVNHRGTEAKAIAILCAGKVGGDGAYQKYYKAVMDGSTNEGGVLDVAKLPEIAKNIGIDSGAWQSCYDKKDTSPQFASQTAEAQKYGLGGTPGTLILNVKTGKYATVEGAYPYTAFTAKVDELLK